VKNVASAEPKFLFLQGMMDAPSSIRSVASSAGALARDLPAFAASPPIEAVVFGWGA
jgi:hypothetical protein